MHSDSNGYNIGEFQGISEGIPWWHVTHSVSEYLFNVYLFFDCFEHHRCVSELLTRASDANSDVVQVYYVCK